MTSAPSTCLVDTNVLVYAVDPQDMGKQERAIAILDHVRASQAGVLSAQILGEFFTTVTRKLPSALSNQDAERLVLGYIASWPVYGLTTSTVAAAVQGLQRYQLSYWDALVWATAREHRVPCILSEDFNDGAVLDGVRFLNPFRADFDPLVRF